MAGVRGSQRCADGVEEEGVFENLGKTNAEFKIDEQEHTADATPTFNGGAPPPPGGRGY
jgi:hypothetical protein